MADLDFDLVDQRIGLVPALCEQKLPRLGEADAGLGQSRAQSAGRCRAAPQWDAKSPRGDLCLDPDRPDFRWREGRQSSTDGQHRPTVSRQHVCVHRQRRKGRIREPRAVRRQSPPAASACGQTWPTAIWERRHSMANIRRISVKSSWSRRRPPMDCACLKLVPTRGCTPS